MSKNRKNIKKQKKTEKKQKKDIKKIFPKNLNVSILTGKTDIKEKKIGFHQKVTVLKYTNNSKYLKELNVGDLVGFTPRSEYEFIINGERLYRVLTKAITIKYEYEGKEKEYNPSRL